MKAPTLVAAIVVLAFGGCDSVSLETRSVVFETEDAMGVVENIVRAETPGGYGSASLLRLPAEALTSASGQTTIGSRFDLRVDCASRSVMTLTVRTLRADESESQPSPVDLQGWETPRPNTALGRTVSAVCEPVFAESKATHKTIPQLRKTYARHLAAGKP